MSFTPASDLVVRHPEPVAAVDGDGSREALARLSAEHVKLREQFRAKQSELLAAKVALRHKVAELDLLYDLERQVSAAPDLDAGLGAVLARAAEVTGAEGGAVLLTDAAAPELHFRGPGGLSLVRARPLDGELGIAGAVAVSGEPLISNDLSAQGDHEPALARRMGYSARSCVCVPLRHGVNVLGALEVLNKTVGEFLEEDMKLMSVIAAQTARLVALGRAREAHAREQRLVSVGQLLSGVLHDLKGPMTVISGYAQLMAAEPDREQRERAAALILKQFDTLNAMTREVLDFARGKVEVFRRKVHVATFVEDLGEQLRRELADFPVTVRVACSCGGHARFDEGKVRRAVSNVARNAAQAMPGGGRFTVRVSRAAERLVFRMSDDGPGIAQEIRGRMFESFATHGKTDGTGLGLPIAKRIAEEHGGTLTWRTRTGRGTLFVLRIPA